jgi:general secretion pathway protein E
MFGVSFFSSKRRATTTGPSGSAGASGRGSVTPVAAAQAPAADARPRRTSSRTPHGANGVDGVAARRHSGVVPGSTSVQQVTQPNHKASVSVAEVPNELKERIAVDRTSMTVWVEHEDLFASLFRTWIYRNKRKKIEFSVIEAKRDEVVAQWNKGHKPIRKVDQGEHRENRDRAYALLEKGAQYVASDIHLNGRGDYTEIQFEVDGELRTVEIIDPEEGEGLERAIYQGIAGVKESYWQTNQIQDAQIPDDRLPQGYGLTSARIIRGPAYPQAKGGSFMTIRLQYSETHPDRTGYKLPALPFPRVPAGEFYLNRTNGLSEDQFDKLDRILSVPDGGILVTGPTGGGKTTFLYECLREKARQMPHKRQVWGEDPNEKFAEWAVQLTVAKKKDEDYGESYAEMGRAALRMAPKTIMLGEARAASVMLEFIRAVQTGHDGWMTVHGNDPFQIVERVEMLDLERLNRRVFCDPATIRAFIAVRLVTALCPTCKVPLQEAIDKSMKHKVKKRVLRDLKTWGSVANVHVRVPGHRPDCPTCSGKGTAGRRLVLEIVLNDDQLSRDFVELGVAAARQNYRRRRKDADPSLLEQTINMVLAGDIDPASIEEKANVMIPKHEADRELDAYATQAAPMAATASQLPPTPFAMMETFRALTVTLESLTLAVSALKFERAEARATDRASGIAGVVAAGTPETATVATLPVTGGAFAGIAQSARAPLEEMSRVG